MSGHKTIAVFKRYNLVTEEELTTISRNASQDNSGTADTSLDANEKEATNLGP